MSEHFSLDELTFSSTAVRLGIDNTPPAEFLPNLQALMDGLEQIRAELGDLPMHIDSGYRCPALNSAVGGAHGSAHMGGWAADFICPAFGTPLMVAGKIVTSAIQFDQVIQEGNWVHVSFDPMMRRQILTATFGPGGASYRSGL